MPISIAENRDNMEAMREFPDKYFDLAVVDPPYKVNMSGGKSPKNGFKGKAYWDKMSAWDIRPGKDYWSQVFRVSKNQIVWGANYFTEHLPPSMGWVFWDKGQRGFSFSDGELAFTSFDKKLSVFDLSRGACNNPENIHPTQKPVALYKWLLTNYAKPGDKILDTHLGSGSSRIAAYDMGFDFWGYELDADYFADEEARFQAHISKPVLFAPEQMYRFEQAELFTPENLETR